MQLANDIKSTKTRLKVQLFTRNDVIAKNEGNIQQSGYMRLISYQRLHVPRYYYCHNLHYCLYNVTNPLITYAIVACNT